MDIKGTFRKSVNEIKNTTKKITDKVTQEYKKNSLKDDIEDLYAELGKIRYSEISENISRSEESVSIYNEIRKLLDELESISEKNEKLTYCRICGKKIPNDIVFCPYCGTKREDYENKTSEDNKKCDFANETENGTDGAESADETIKDGKAEKTDE